MVYFIVTVYDALEKKDIEYAEYIGLVKPIVEKYGGRYIVRSDKVTTMHRGWKPDRVVIIEWNTRWQLESWLASEEYKNIAYKREQFVDSRAIIVED